jgi:predicted nucleotidyltransferase
MLEEVELRVLAAFFPDAGEKTLRELQGRSGYSYERVYSAVRSLEQKGLVSGKKVGKTLVYSILTSSDAALLAFIYSTVLKKEQFTKKFPRVWKVLDEFLAKADLQMAVLFGSHAKGEAREGSDIDLLCVDGDDAEKVALSLMHKYNMRIAPVMIKIGDFRNIKEENPEFWRDLVEFGIVLKGREIFYETVYRRSGCRGT